MAAEISPSLSLSLTVEFPGGTVSSDLRVLGFREPSPELSALQPSEVVTLNVDVANDHPTKAYRITDARLVQDTENGGVNVAAAIMAQGDIAAGDLDGMCMVQITMRGAGFRGKQTGNYRLHIIGEEVGV